MVAVTASLVLTLSWVNSFDTGSINSSKLLGRLALELIDNLSRFAQLLDVNSVVFVLPFPVMLLIAALYQSLLIPHWPCLLSSY